MSIVQMLSKRPPPSVSLNCVKPRNAPPGRHPKDVCSLSDTAFSGRAQHVKRVCDLKAISLFSGMGGDTLGMENAGLKVVAYSEIVETFRQTHELNFGACKCLGKDITKITDEEFRGYADIDFLFAGFPCQSFSTAGKRKANDPRNSMFTHFVRAAKHTNAKVIIGENVKGLLTKKMENGDLYITAIVSEFENLGYTVDYKVLKCHKHGVPQRRERLFIVGIKTDHLTKFQLKFPEEEAEELGLKKIIKFDMNGTMELPVTDVDFGSLPEECIMTDMDNTEEAHGAHPYLPHMSTFNKTYKGKTYECLFSFAKRDSPVHCEIIDVRKPSKTIICTYDHQPRLLVPTKNANGQYLRKMTPTELKQIQSFPPNYLMAGNTKQQITQIGNAVPPLVVEKLIRTIIAPSRGRF